MEATILLQFNGIELTEETINETREWFANNAIECIEEAKSGKVRVNNRVSYIVRQKQRAEEYLRGDNDCTIAFLQRAYFIQTGECVALFPN